jgi:hypothetical protein
MKESLIGVGVGIGMRHGVVGMMGLAWGGMGPHGVGMGRMGPHGDGPTGPLCGMALHVPRKSSTSLLAAPPTTTGVWCPAAAGLTTLHPPSLGQTHLRQ